MEVVKRIGEVECVEIAAKSVINRVSGMPFRWSINPYRGCYHQCVFCYARRTHGFLDQDGIAGWGTRLYAKVNAPEVVRAELARPGWQREDVAIGTVTDPYQPVEGSYRLTRRILAELARGRTPARIVTRSPLVVRDTDVLADVARSAGVTVCISIPTLDAGLARRLEPAVAPPAKRLFAMQTLAAHGIHVGLALAPIIPGLTDTRDTYASVLRAARDCGAAFAWSSLLYLREEARDSFFTFLRDRYPEYVDDYQRMYRGIYAADAVQRRVEADYAAEARAVRFSPGDLIRPEAAEEQLALF